MFLLPKWHQKQGTLTIPRVAHCLPSHPTIIPMLITHEEVLSYWFGLAHTERSATDIADAQSALWWGKSPAVDADITTRFSSTVEAASTGALASWATTPRGLLALIISTDQFPRNIHRDTPQAFAHDPLALALAHICVDTGAAQTLHPIERVFAYLPFEHSELLPAQHRSLALYQALAASIDTADVATAKLFTDYLDFARQHHGIIARFGRYPHRNQILSRPSTAKELVFLKQSGSSF